MGGLVRLPIALLSCLVSVALACADAPASHQVTVVGVDGATWKVIDELLARGELPTFRSLIASCALHDIKAYEYLEQVLRLAPHWRVSRMLELSPKYWKATLAKLDERQRKILVPPWESEWPYVEATAPPGRRAAQRTA